LKRLRSQQSGPSSALLGYFEWPTKQYKRIAIDEQVEVLSLLGDVAVAEEEPLCISMPFSGEPMAAWSAAILETHVRPTLEIILIQPPSYLRKRKDPVTGLPLIGADAS
jgi:uncharacterized protein